MRKNSARCDYLIAITGASGSIYAHRLIEELLIQGKRLGLIFTRAAQQVFAYELQLPNNTNWAELISSRYDSQRVIVYDNECLFAAPASGSRTAKAMIVVPTSMGTLSRIAGGNSANLLERAADVYIKEKRPLLLVPRETPLSAIHLENMLKLSRLGVRIIPAMPGFYQKPQTMIDLVDFVVGKILEGLELEHSLYPSWEEQGAV